MRVPVLIKNEEVLVEGVFSRLSIVKKINRFSAEIETIDGNQGVIEYASINWTKKNFEELFVVGDIIYTQKRDINK